MYLCIYMYTVHLQLKRWSTFTTGIYLVYLHSFPFHNIKFSILFFSTRWYSLSFLHATAPRAAKVARVDVIVQFIFHDPLHLLHIQSHHFTTLTLIRVSLTQPDGIPHPTLRSSSACLRL